MDMGILTNARDARSTSGPKMSEICGNLEMANCRRTLLRRLLSRFLPNVTVHAAQDVAMATVAHDVVSLCSLTEEFIDWTIPKMAVLSRSEITQNAKRPSSNLWNEPVPDECAVMGTCEPFDPMNSVAHVHKAPEGAFERRFCGVLVAAIWVIVSVIVCCLVRI
jgi:hypothetical protein